MNRAKSWKAHASCDCGRSRGACSGWRAQGSCPQPGYSAAERSSFESPRDKPGNHRPARSRGKSGARGKGAKAAKKASKPTKTKARAVRASAGEADEA